MDARLVRVPFRQVLVSRPRHHALGLLIVDVLISLQVARARRVPLVLLRGEQGEDSPMLHLVAEGVARLDNRLTGARLTSRAWTMLMGAIRIADGVLAPRRHLISAAFVTADVSLSFLASVVVLPRLLRKKWNAGLRVLQTRLDTNPSPKGTRRARVKRLAQELLERWKVEKFDQTSDPRERVLVARVRTLARIDERRHGIPQRRDIHHGHDLRRLCVEEPLRTDLSPADERLALRLARELGLTDRPLVTLHVRDGGSKRDAASHGFIRDVARDARMESYLPAIDYLVSRGYTVVRIGDASMAPVQRPGLVDVATHPQGGLLLDLWCVRNSRFFIACDSGPYMLSWLFNVPCLAVNITNVLGVFPLRAWDLYLIKMIQETATLREVPLSEMLTTEFLAPLRRRMAKEGSLRYVDNDESDILAAVREMEEGLLQPQPETPLQRTYRQRIEEIRNGPLVRAKLSEKTGGGEVLMGEGRVVHAFVERHFGGERDGGASQ